jgi:hypothetical protein
LSQARQRDKNGGQLIRRGQETYYRRDRNGKGLDVVDPLGLLEMQREMKRRGWVAVKVLSGMGLLGGLAWWWWEGVGEKLGGLEWGGLGIRDWLDLGGGLR